MRLCRVKRGSRINCRSGRVFRSPLSRVLGRGPVVRVRGAVARPRVRAAAGRHRVLRLGRRRRRRSRGHRGVLRRLDRPHHRGQHERLLREEELSRRQHVDTRVRDAAVLGPKPRGGARGDVVDVSGVAPFPTATCSAFPDATANGCGDVRSSRLKATNARGWGPPERRDSFARDSQGKK